MIGFSQNSKIDSLKSLLTKTSIDSTKIKLLNKLFLNLEFIDQNQAKRYLDDAVNLALKNNDPKGLTETYINCGFLAEDNSNYPEALKYYRLVLEIAQKHNLKPRISAAYNNIGVIHYNLGNYPEALKSYFESLKIDELLNDKHGIAFSYNNMGLVHEHMGNNKEALKNFEKSLEIKKELKDSASFSSAYNNIGLVYYNLREYDKALQYFKLALDINIKQEDAIGIINSNNNISSIYSEIGKPQEALNMYINNLALEKEIDDPALMTRSYINIGSLLTSMKRTAEAKKYLNDALRISKALNHKEYIKESYRALTDLYKTSGQYEEALKSFDLWLTYRDSLNNEETKRSALQSQMNFEFEKKEAVADAEHQKEMENQKLLANEKSRKQTIIIICSVVGLILVAVFAGFIFRSLNITRKQKHIIELQKSAVEKQKQLIEEQKIIVEEHQKEMIDSITYAKRIQRAILPSDEDIKTHWNNSFILYLPKDIVAGDFYWQHVSADGEITYIAAADSTGHGVPGAMVSVVCSNALNRAVSEFNLVDPGLILDKTRELVLETFSKSGEEIKDGMDISLLAYHKQLNKVYWSGANNPLWYIRHSNSSENEPVLLAEVKADKQPIGKTDSPVPFKTHVFDINTPHTFYLMTDGYADQFGGEKGKKFKYKQLEQTIISITQQSMTEQKTILEEIFQKWRGNLEQVDDVTIIGINFS